MNHLFSIRSCYRWSHGCSLNNSIDKKKKNEMAIAITRLQEWPQECQVRHTSDMKYHRVLSGAGQTGEGLSVAQCQVDLLAVEEVAGTLHHGSPGCLFTWKCDQGLSVALAVEVV